MRKLNYLMILISAFFSGCDKDTPGPILPLLPNNECVWNGTDSLVYLHSIHCSEEFNALAGPPILQIHSNVNSVKVVYEIATAKLYFSSASAFYLHYDFCREILGYPKSHSAFNAEQYVNGPERLYYLASVNHYSSSGIYTLEFFSDDRVDAKGLQTVYSSVADSCFFGRDLKFLPTSTRLQQLSSEVPGISVIDESTLYGSQNYQALNLQKAYGYLRKVNISDIGSTYLGRHDIIVVNGLPLDIPVIAGIITNVFQTPLSHINVLSHNRGTPNMALKTAWEDTLISRFVDKLVYLEVRADSFLLREASQAEADSFWSFKEPRETIVLECRDDSAGLFDMQDLSHESLNLVGAKAANFAELSKIKMGDESMPVPDAAFAIPFYYYRKHLSENGIDTYIQSILSDSLFKTDYRRRMFLLEKLRDTIVNAPLDKQFLREVEDKIRTVGNYKRMRFRSSTNVEDIEGFNGAGLYESHTGIIDDSKKTVEKAIKKVFASLWTLRGFEERDYFKIDHNSAAMAILVHRSFPDEEANGVAITGNIYLPLLTAYTINVQIKDISVVSPPQGFIADQFLFHIASEDAFEDPSIEYISKSNINNGEPVMTNEEIVLLAKWLLAINQHFYRIFQPPFPSQLFMMDVEFKLDEERKLCIKQARPY
ncbi:MAG: hypothetical protein GX267_04345 [Fibrobacter sp.]|jgi:pyruvate,water dikinase|nr:hypothetical protein [Fibrobacter sp.]